MSSRGIVGVDGLRCCVILMACALAPLAQGCGSSQEGTGAGGTGAVKEIKPEESYGYVGEGKAKKKVGLGRRDREKLKQEATKGGD